MADQGEADQEEGADSESDYSSDEENEAIKTHGQAE